MIPKNKSFNTICFFLSLFGFLLLALNFPSPAVSQPQKLESNVKKIVMMMNIVKKEYHAGIAEGKVINSAEYEESQVFLEQAYNRYQKLVNGANPQGQKDDLANRFSSLGIKIKAKEDPGVIQSEINAINSGILKKFNIQLSQTPSETGVTGEWPHLIHE